MSDAVKTSGAAELRRFKPYPDHKVSRVDWLGQIPAHWEALALKRVVNSERPVTYGIVQCGPEYPNGVPYIRPVDMDDEGGVALEDLQRTSPEIAAAYARSTVRPNDIVVSIGPSFGKVMIVPPELDGANLTQGTARIAPGRLVTSRFLFWVLRSRSSQQAWDSYCSGATFRALTLQILETCAIALPPIDEQRPIAAFLDRETAKIDASVAKKERLIELLQEKRAALITRAVTKGLDPNVPMRDSGAEWLGEIPAHWEVKRIRHIVSNVEQGWSPDCENREATEDEWGVLKAGCVNRGLFLESEHKALPSTLDPILALEIRDGDLLMSRASGSRDLVGSVAIVHKCRPRLLLCDKVFRLHVQPRAGHKPFLAFAMNSRPVRWQIEVALSGGSGLANNIAQEVVKDLIIAQPPEHEQRAIVDFLGREMSRIDLLISEIRLAINRLKEMRIALISAAVTGKIDLRGEVA